MVPAEEADIQAIINARFFCTAARQPRARSGPAGTSEMHERTSAIASSTRWVWSDRVHELGYKRRRATRRPPAQSLGNNTVRTSLLKLDDVIWFPGLIEKRDISSIEAHDRHEVSSFYGLDPVHIPNAVGFGWPEIEVY